jgi:hypothetical protein
VVADTKAAQETRALSLLFKTLQADVGKATYGLHVRGVSHFPCSVGLGLGGAARACAVCSRVHWFVTVCGGRVQHVEHALERGAVDTLLVSDALLRCPDPAMRRRCVSAGLLPPARRPPPPPPHDPTHPLPHLCSSW